MTKFLTTVFHIFDYEYPPMRSTASSSILIVPSPINYSHIETQNPDQKTHIVL